MIWWRVELDASGKVLRLRRCAQGGADTATVVYVTAKNERAANKKAYLAHQRILQRKRRAQYAKQGLCRCGRERDDKAFRWCSLCRERGRIDGKRSYERSMGREVKAPSKTKAFQERRASTRESDRLATLLEVREHWIEMGDSGRFSKWLKTEIDKLTKREAA